MLTAIMRLFGIDLEQKVHLLKGHLHDAVEETSSRFRGEVQALVRFVMFTGLGAVGLVAAIGIAAAALFVWLDREDGPLVALAAIGGICAAFAIVMFVLAMTRRRTRKAPAHPGKAPAPQQPATQPMVGDRARPASIPLSIAPLAENASLVDRLTHRFGQQAIAASDEAVERAEKLLREGSRGTLLTTLALAAIVGVVIGRTGGLHRGRW
jgi:hypothetical protein